MLYRIRKNELISSDKEDIVSHLIYDEKEKYILIQFWQHEDMVLNVQDEEYESYIKLFDLSPSLLETVQKKALSAIHSHPEKVGFPQALFVLFQSISGYNFEYELRLEQDGVGSLWKKNEKICDWKTFEEGISILRSYKQKMAA